MRAALKILFCFFVLQTSIFPCAFSQNQEDSISSSTISAQADNELIFDPPIIYVDPENPDVPDISSDYTVGTSNGSFKVTESGAAEYFLSINVPDGGALTPEIGLLYNSQNAAYGAAGYGVSITGFSAITRGEQNLFNNNGIVSGVTYTASDNLFLDGKRFILTSGSKCQDGATYCLEGDPFTTIIAHGTYDDTCADVWFEVQTSDGRIYHYGSSQSSRIEFKDKEDKNRIASWYVDRMEDVYHNYIQYYYSISNYYAYPSSIHYGMNSQQDRQLSNAIYFIYENLGASPYYFNVGCRKGQINRRLSNIRIQGNTDLFRKYTLSYDISSDQSSCEYARLVKIQEENGKGESLPPTQFHWQFLPSGYIYSSAIDFPTTEGNARVKEQSKNFYAADLNGDGVSDIIRVSPVEITTVSSGNYSEWTRETRVYISVSQVSSNRVVSYSDPLTYKLPSSISIGDINLSMGGSFLLDFDGDGYNDLVFPYYQSIEESSCREYFYVIRGSDVKNGRICTPASLYIELRASKESPLLVSIDTDKDGRDDLLSLEQSPINSLYQANIVKLKKSTVPEIQEFKLTFSAKPQKLFSGDYNNDGLTDIIVLYSGGYKIYFNNGGSEDALKFTETNCKTGTDIADCWRVTQGDFDGDGLIDFVYNISGESCLWIARNNGDGTFTCSKSDDIGVSDGSSRKDDDKFAIMVYDIDRDGRSDVMVCKTGYKKNGFPQYNYVYTNTQVKWLFSDGTNLKLKKNNTISQREDDALESSIFLGDFDGDGNMEVANYGSNLLNLNTAATFAENKINIYKTLAHYPGTGRINSFTDGLGNVETVSYAYSTDPDVYSRTESENSYPVNIYSLPLSVVKNVSSTNGSSETQKYAYTYKNLKIHIKGAGALGFSETSTTNTLTGEVTRTIITEMDSVRWIPTKTEVINTIGGKSSSVVSSNTVENVGNTYFVYESASTVTDIYGNTATTVSSYDASKGVLLEQTVMNDGDNMYKKVVYSDYEKKSTGWLPKWMTMIQKHADDPEPYSSKTIYKYDDNGNILTTIANYGFRQELVTRARYDVLGNCTFSELRGFGIRTVSWYNEYDPTGRFVVKKYSKPASTVTTFTYDKWGNVLTENDETDSSNILTTTHTYDNWGQRISTLAPDGTKVTTETGWGAENNKQYYTLARTSGRPWVLTWYDSRGREVEQESFGPQNVRVVKYTTYNSSGLVSRVENLSGKFWAAKSITYDEMNRVQTEQLSTGKETSYTYGNRSVSTTSAGRTSTKTVDAWGNTLTSTDSAGGTVSYVYKSNGKPKSVTSNGSTVYMEYDSIGCVASITDPDAGTVKSQYSSHGKLMSRVDAKGVETTYTYDKLGRVATVSIGEHLITNTYGTSGSDLLRLKQQTMDGKSIAYTYDRYGRIIHEKRTIPDIGVFNESYTYDEQNRLSETYYPDGLVVKYGYDDYGFRTSATAGDMPIYALDEYRGPANYTSTFMGNITSSVICDLHGFPKSSQIALGDSILEKLEFEFDRLTGNLKSRTTNNSLVDSFEYDNLDRLLSESWGLKIIGSIQDRKTPIIVLPPKIIYAPNGNILYKPGVGNYTYNSDFKPHAVIAVDNTDGKIPSEALITVFNDFGKIQTIEDESTGRTTDFVYGPDLQRWYSRLAVNGNDSIQTVYVGNYEKITENGHTRQFYYLDGGTIVIKENGTFKPYLAFTDYLGSIRTVVDEEGKEVFEAKYDAWGVQEVTLNAIGLRRGYTGHEMLSEYGIINMNGRLYDPMLGRFFSPDSFVQFPGFTQSYNRYSYCLNNPLKFSDPSGQISIAAVFSIFNVFSSMLQAAINGENVWKAGLLSALRAGATYGIGSAFGAFGSVGHELLRAGAHGVAGGIFSALSGGSFGSGFAAGAISSAAGSLAQGFKMNTMQMILTSTAAGGIAAWASGGNFLSGAMQGLCVGLLNHAEHQNVRPETKYYYDGNGELHGELPEFVCTANRPATDSSSSSGSIFEFAGAAITITDSFGKSLEQNSRNSTFGTNGKFYFKDTTKSPFYGNQYVKTAGLSKVGKSITNVTGPIGNFIGASQIFMGGYEDYQTYQNEGSTNLFHSVKAGGEFLGGWGAACAGLKAGGWIGGIVGSHIYGIGAIPGAIIGGAIVGILGAYYGGELGGYAIDFLYSK